MRWLGKVRQWWGVASKVWVCVFLAFLAYQFVVNEPKAARAQRDLEAEFRLVTPMAHATVVQYAAVHKTEHALVYAYYSDSVTYEELREHYDLELSRLRWHFAREEPVTESGRDLGGKEAYYCKGSYQAGVFHTGDAEYYKYTYAVSLSYGLTNHC